MKHVRRTDVAIADVRPIRAYIEQGSVSHSAKTIVDILVPATDSLLSHPGAGPQIAGTSLHKWRPRGVDHVLIYRRARDGIAIVRVRHVAGDWRPAG